jgi:hypothetical protein
LFNDAVGRAIAQAVSRRLPTPAARVRARVSSCRICGGQSGAGAGLLRVLRLPLPILIPPTAPHSSGAGTIDQLVADVPSGLSLTPPQETNDAVSGITRGRVIGWLVANELEQILNEVVVT